MAVLAARNNSEPSAVEFGNLIPYVRFLERRAWREKIADDFRRLEHQSVEIQPVLTQTLTVETGLGVENRTERVMANTNPGRELMCPVCPKKLRYVTTRNEDGYVHQKRDSFKTAVNVHVYECASHGRFHMGPNGRLTSGG